MLASNDIVRAEGKPDSEVMNDFVGREFASKRLKLAATMVAVGAAAVLILSQGTALPWHWRATEVSPLAGTLFLAVGVVLLANYLSAGRRSKAGQGERIGYDRNASLDL